MIDTATSTPYRLLDENENLYDLKRLLIQEKGEEEYYFLYNEKSGTL